MGFIDHYMNWIGEYHSDYFGFESGQYGDQTFYRMENNTILDHKKFQKILIDISIKNKNDTKDEIYKKLHEIWKQCNII